MEAAKIVGEQQTIQRNNFERNFIFELKVGKNEVVKDTIDLLYNQELIDSIQINDQNFDFYVTFSDDYLWEKYGHSYMVSHTMHVFVSMLLIGTVFSSVTILCCIPTENELVVTYHCEQKCSQKTMLIHVFESENFTLRGISAVSGCTRS